MSKEPGRRHRPLAAAVLAAVGAGLITAAVFLGIATVALIDRVPGDFSSSPAATAHPVSPWAPAPLLILTIVCGLAGCATLLSAAGAAAGAGRWGRSK